MGKTRIILPDGSEITSGIDQYNAIKSVSLSHRVNDQTELTTGSVCCSMLEATVIAPEGQLHLEAGTQVQLYKDETRVGLFTLEKPSRVSANILKLIAYDRVSLFVSAYSRYWVCMGAGLAFSAG